MSIYFLTWKMSIENYVLQLVSVYYLRLSNILFPNVFLGFICFWSLKEDRKLRGGERSKNNGDPRQNNLV